ncbi:MAG: crossover junction endodeoxyribonuclease RuvC [Bacteroidales bacterium]|nr:crossover junction endodeoxyribonuclease RuvC [Bacteroidales bacterium]
MEDNRIILGIDPGTTIMGYGLIEIINKKPGLITLGYIELHKTRNHFEKLQKIFNRTLMLIDEFHPEELAIESPFYGNNVQSMLKLGRAQGVAISAALYRNLPIYEYAPRKIKQSITGQGNASKEQVARLLQKFLQINELPGNLDATDGLAVAMCHFYQKNSMVSGGEYKSWSDYLRKNPERLKRP